MKQASVIIPLVNERTAHSLALTWTRQSILHYGPDPAEYPPLWSVTAGRVTPTYSHLQAAKLKCECDCQSEPAYAKCTMRTQMSMWHLHDHSRVTTFVVQQMQCASLSLLLIALSEIHCESLTLR